MTTLQNRHTGETRHLSQAATARFFDNRCPSDWHCTQSSKDAPQESEGNHKIQPLRFEEKEA